MKRKLFVDFDSTITNSIKAYCDAYAYLYKNNDKYTEPNPDKVNTWNFSCECPLATDSVEYIFGHPYFFRTLELFPLAREVLQELSHKYELIICSIGTPENVSHKAIWVQDNLPFIKNVILITNDGVKMNKGIIDMSNSIFIDDHIDNLISSNAEIKICFGKEYSWNKDWQGLWGKNWLEVNKLID